MNRYFPQTIKDLQKDYSVQFQPSKRKLGAVITFTHNKTEKFDEVEWWFSSDVVADLVQKTTTAILMDMFGGIMQDEQCNNDKSAD